MAMKDVKSAADLRRVITKIVKNVIDKERPETRQGRVFSYDTQTNTAMVLFPGNTIEGLVPVTFGKNMIPSVAMIDTFDVDGYSAAGDVVRVAGRPNDWYVVGFSVGLPISEHTQITAVANFAWDQTVVSTLGDQTIECTYIPVESSEHVYWGGAQLPNESWTRDGRTITLLDPEFHYHVGRKLICRYAWIEADQLPAEVVDVPPALPDIVIDVPAWGVDNNVVFANDNLSDTSTATELVVDDSTNGHVGVGIYSVDGTGSGNIEMPATPAGYALAHATYVVIAYAASSETLVDPTDWSPDTPDPTQAPFLMVETSATGVNFTLDPIPVGAYAGETVWVGDDKTNVLADIPANRLWLQSYSNIPIHVAYLAVRLTYTAV